MTLAEFTNLSSEQLAGIGAGLAAIGAAALSAWKQKAKPDATEAEKSTFGNTVRLHRDDRQRMDDFGEKVSELTRAVKSHAEIVEDHAAAIRRKAPRS